MRILLFVFSFLSLNVFGQDQTDRDSAIYTMVEQMPEFPGGQDALFSYIKTNLSYPAEARKNGKEGKVYIKFVVDQEGKITDAAVARGVDPLLDAEALRIVNSLPDWKPGFQGGKAVKVSYMLPFSFTLSP
jgi:periplasmic protein TonB